MRILPAARHGLFEGILQKLLEENHGTYVVCDQCRYGKIDLGSGKPVGKSTGFLTSGEIILNHFGKKCRCHFGAHEPVVGHNRFGQRSKLASSYPLALCKAVCQGVLETMKFDYVTAFTTEQGFGVLSGEDEQAEMEVSGDDPEAGDIWEKKPGMIIRYHVIPRQQLFSPMAADGMPCAFHDILPFHKTFKEEVEDEWTSPVLPVSRDSSFWTGRTEVKIKELELMRTWRITKKISKGMMNFNPLHMMTSNTCYTWRWTSNTRCG